MADTPTTPTVPGDRCPECRDLLTNGKCMNYGFCSQVEAGWRTDNEDPLPLPVPGATPPACPECGSGEVGRVTGRTTYCRSCGHHFATPASAGESNTEWTYTPEFNADGSEKHVTRDGARYHVLSWSTSGTHCSEPNCEVNRPASAGEGEARCKCGDPACMQWREDIPCEFCIAEHDRITSDPDFEGKSGDMGEGHYGDCPHGIAQPPAPAQEGGLDTSREPVERLADDLGCPTAPIKNHAARMLQELRRERDAARRDLAAAREELWAAQCGVSSESNLRTQAEATVERLRGELALAQETAEGFRTDRDYKLAALKESEAGRLAAEARLREVEAEIRRAFDAVDLVPHSAESSRAARYILSGVLTTLPLTPTPEIPADEHPR